MPTEGFRESTGGPRISSRSRRPFYQRALGAKLEALQRFGDVDQSCPAAMKSQVRHAALRVGDAFVMMSALAANGTVVQPLIDAPWGDLFGALGDEFGINWMFNSARVKKA